MAEETSVRHGGQNGGFISEVDSSVGLVECWEACSGWADGFRFKTECVGDLVHSFARGFVHGRECDAGVVLC